MAAAAAWRTAASREGTAAWRGGNDNVLMVRARSGGDGTDTCGGGDGDGDCNDGWTPSLTFCEQPLGREETPFFSQMTATVCGGGCPFPSYRAQDGLRGERAHLSP